MGEGAGSIRFGEFTLDPAGRRLERGGREISLQPQVFATLAYLAESGGRVVTKQELLSALWPDAVVGEAALTRCVSQLRRALGDDTKAPRFGSGCSTWQTAGRSWRRTTRSPSATSSPCRMRSAGASRGRCRSS